MWLQFVCIGLVACAVAAIFAVGPRWSTSPKTRRTFTAAISLVALLAVSMTFLAPTGITLGDSTPWFDRSPWRESILFVLMLAGMAGRFVTQAIEERRARMKEKSGRPVSIRFDAWDFVYPMMVSVITFGVLLQQLDSEAMSAANVVMSFQTGFFWQTILARANGKAE